MKFPTWIRALNEEGTPVDEPPLQASARAELQKVYAALAEAEAPVSAAEPPPDTSPSSPQPPAAAPVAKEQGRDRSLYKAVLASLYDAVIIVDQKGYIIASNRRAESFFGHSEADFWNLPCSNLITGFNPLVLGKIRAHVASGRFTVLNANCLRKDGSSFPAEIAISHIHYLNDGDLLMSIRSLERRKKADERRELELDAVRSTSVGLMICNREGLIEFVNPSWLRLMRLENEHQAQRRFLGDFCESLESAEQILRRPSAQASWMGSAVFRNAAGRPLNCTVTSALCPLRRNGSERLAISIMPAPAAARPATGA